MKSIQTENCKSEAKVKILCFRNFAIGAQDHTILLLTNVQKIFLTQNKSDFSSLPYTNMNQTIFFRAYTLLPNEYFHEFMKESQKLLKIGSKKNLYKNLINYSSSVFFRNFLFLHLFNPGNNKRGKKFKLNNNNNN